MEGKCVYFRALESESSQMHIYAPTDLKTLKKKKGV